MMKYLLLPFVLSVMFLSAARASTTDITLTANILNTSCQVTVDNGGRINLGTVDLDYLNKNTDVDQVYSGGAPFAITVSNCAPAGGKNPTKLTVNFTPIAGALAPTNQQVFANQSVGGASNVGIVILSTQDAQNIFNVLDSHGQTRSIYSVTLDQLNNGAYHFHARMQKIAPAEAATSGLVKASVFVSVYYE